MSPQKWIKETNAIGISSKSGRYGGGTYAHSDIAFKFASWISAEFELYLVREFKRLKEAEQKQISLNANWQKLITIYTDIKNNLIPKELTAKQTSIIYAMSRIEYCSFWTNG